MAKGGSGLAAPVWKATRSPVNTGAPWPSVDQAEARYSGSSASCASAPWMIRPRRNDGLHNHVCDPATMLMAWRRVRGNKGSRSAGVDGETAYHVEQVLGVERFLGRPRAASLGSYRPVASASG